VRSGNGLGCSVNPVVGHEKEVIEKASVSKNIAIVGGGLAGMQAAVSLHQRGHKVTLYEKNKKVLVVGGGLIGTEIAVKLLSKGNKVFLVEMLGEIARGMEMLEQKLTLKALQHENVNIFLNTKIQKICDDKVQIEGPDYKQTIENIDVIVLATGMKSYNPFENIKQDKPIHIIGDALKPGKAQDAIHGAYETAKKI
jgi:pyruvate/2-oxoglutarate dehydrogenase complex dihydrolipoamide dehydrogenase (E3) component